MTAEPNATSYADRVERLLGDQAGVAARAQLVEAGCAPHDIERLLRRRERRRS